MYQLINVTAVCGAEATLIITPEKTALVDSGFAFCAEKLVENIKNALDGRDLDYILLTHSHYDHAGGAAICRTHFKNAKIAASEYAAKIFAKPTAIAVMREMDRNAALVNGFTAPYEDKLDELSADIILHEGDCVDLGSLKMKVLNAAGHTRCSIAYFDEKERLMVGSETYGVPVSPDVVEPCYIIGYEMSMEALRKGMACDPKTIILPHIGVMEGEENCRDYFKKAYYWAVKAKDDIVAGYKAGKTQEELIQMWQDYFYIDVIKDRHPLKAFLLNAGYTLPMIIKECAGEN